MFTVDELLKATKGKLISGGPRVSIKGISIDSRVIKRGEAFIALKGNNFDGHNFIHQAIEKKASCILYEAGVIGQKPKGIVFIKVRDTTKALGDIARFHRKKFTIPVIAVTGSNGKTTTKEMIAWALSGKYKVLKNIGTKNNHIGLPMALLGLDHSYDAAVLEVGTNHFGEVEYLAKICLANIGVITNIGPAHLEYFKSLDGVFREKSTLTKYLRQPSVAILNTDDSLLKKGSAAKKDQVIFGVGIKNKSDFTASNIKDLAGKMEFLVNQKYKFTLKTLGYYNIYNALIAITVARLFGMEYNRIARRLSGFSFPESRLNFVRFNNIQFIDDTYNSNPLSLKAALEALGNFKTEGRRIFVMGDMLELGKDRESFHYQAGLQAAGICDIFISVGRLSSLASKALKAHGRGVKNIFNCATSLEARDILYKKISPRRDDIVLVKGSRMMRMEEVFKV
ncbi:MAG: UDP-N-acetylmuramoyl-tripeptide--D-alanyl-D-alanine ligase [Candidatus Omnitrophica bacterium]|nr:UDP-N-acetylmuramoyl-tripeptide--D-alanyl-D-alanine ligase [Candidatus Omnitrophota bacterium]